MTDEQPIQPAELHGRRVQPGRKLEIRVADAAPEDHFASHRRGPCGGHVAQLLHATNPCCATLRLLLSSAFCF